MNRAGGACGAGGGEIGPEYRPKTTRETKGSRASIRVPTLDNIRERYAVSSWGAALLHKAAPGCWTRSEAPHPAERVMVSDGVPMFSSGRYGM